MFSRLESRPDFEQTSRASHYSGRAEPCTMCKKGAESVATSNGKAPLDQGGGEKLESISQTQTARNGTRGYNSPTEASPRSTKSMPSPEATGGFDSFDPTNSPSQATSISPETFYPIEKEGYHREECFSEFTKSTPTAPSRPSDPMQQPTAVDDPRPVDDDAIYNIGDTKIYDQTQKAIPKLYEARWQVIRADIFDRVHKRLRRGRFAASLKRRKAPTIIDLMSAGVTKASSKPAVLVVIPRHVKTMQDFLDTDSTVQSRCKPEDGTTVELLPFACKGSSTLIGMPSDPFRDNFDPHSDSNSEFLYLSDDYFGEESSESDDSHGPPTLITSRVLKFDLESVSVVHDPKYVAGHVKHGMGIRLVTKDGSQYVRGTCGGVLHLLVPRQAPRLVGLIAGHLLEQLGEGCEDTSNRTLESPQAIGGISFPHSLEGLPLCDWALFDATTLGFEQNSASQESVIVAQEPEFPNESTEVVIRTSRGEVAGMLSSSSSGIMLNADQGFVHVRTIMMSRGSLLTKGDSGSWVFQKEDGKVYGFVIATNGNTHAYMVPMHAALAEMQSTLGAVTITLAISTDPHPQVYPGTTHEQIGQTDRSIIYSDVGESVQSGSMLSSHFSSASNSVQTRSILSYLPDGHGNSPSRIPHPHPRPNRTTVSSPASSVASLQEQLMQVDQSQVMMQHRLAKDNSMGSPQEQSPQLDPKQPQRIQDQELGLQEGLTKANPIISSLEKPSQVNQSQPPRDHSHTSRDQCESRRKQNQPGLQERLANAASAVSSQGQLSQVDQSQLDSKQKLANAASVISSVEQILDVDHSQLRLEDRLAKTFLREGRVDEAISILKRVVETREKVFGQDHASCLVSQHELAVAFIQNGQAFKAIGILEHVVHMEATNLDNSDVDRLTSQHELARAFLANGQVSEAIKRLEYVVKMKAMTLGESDPHLLASQIVLAEAYLSANRASEAISILENVVAVSTAPSSEYERIRSTSLHWLSLARMQRNGMHLERLSGQRSRPTSIFLLPKNKT